MSPSRAMISATNTTAIDLIFIKLFYLITAHCLHNRYHLSPKSRLVLFGGRSLLNKNLPYGSSVVQTKNLFRDDL